MEQALTILDVVDRGIPNKERIPIKVNADYYLGSIWIGVGIYNGNDRIFPLNDNIMWLGAGWVKAGDWVFIYTGRGAPKTDKLPNSENSIYTVFWNRSTVVFKTPELHPFILDGLIGLPPACKVDPHTQALIDAMLGKASE